MRARLVACVLVGAAGLGMGCSGTGGHRGEAFRPEVTVGDQAALYIYRTGGGGRVTLWLDQEPLGNIHGGEYIVRVVKPGEHFVRAEGASSMALSMKLAPGDAGYMEVASKFGNHPMLTTPEEASARRRIAGAVKVTPASNP